MYLITFMDKKCIWLREKNTYRVMAISFQFETFVRLSFN